MLATLLLVTAAVAADGGEVQSKFIASGATAKAGGYRPIRAEMKEKSDAVKKAPEGLAAAKYGTIKLSGREWGFILDEPAEGKAKLYVDTNNDGDYTNDPATQWRAVKRGPLTMHQGGAKIELDKGKLAQIRMYRFDPKDPARAVLKNTLLYYSDFGHELTLKLDGKSFKTFVSGDLQPRMRLWIDRDNNRKRSSKLETIYVGRPFNFTGTTYVLKAGKGSPTLTKADTELPQTPMPPNLAIGKKALEFKMKTLDGKEIEFPKSYKGKLVMLDFWATWCGPCIAELPNVKKAYKEHHEAGFDILGISFDQANMEEKLSTFIKKNEMPWQHIYEGKGWNTTLGEKYDVSGIPFVLLVDGDTGEILATARQLRGPGLSDFIAKALERKKTGKDSGSK